VAIDPLSQTVATVTAIAIFVKTPGLSPIKTRLVKSIGQPQAEHWHQLAALAVAEVATLSDIGPVYFAVAEPEGLHHPLWSQYERLVQPEGGLGQRMAQIHQTLVERHGAALLLGADTPQIGPEELITAHRWLSEPSPRQIIGPATDGGFWTYGANSVIGVQHWESVQYSLPSTGSDFQRAMDGFGEWCQLKQKTDVDEATDLITAKDELLTISEKNPKQEELLRWLEHSQLGS